jgi:RNA polymerase sigma-70 factor (ECF subfamily)
LLDQVAGGDAGALDQLLSRYQPDLLAFIECRLDPRVRARINSSDVVQEAQLEVVRRMDDYLKRRPMPFHLWVRKTAYKRLLNLQRDHRLRAKRSVDREVVLPADTSSRLAGPLLAKGPSPSAQFAAREQAERIADAIAQLAEPDREILLINLVFGIPYGLNGIMGVPTGPLTVALGNEIAFSQLPDETIRTLAASLRFSDDFRIFQAKALELAFLVQRFEKVC